MINYLFYMVFAYYVVLFFIKIKSQRLKICLYAFPLVLIIILKYGIGADYFSYQYLYESLSVSSIGNFFNSLTRVEIGFRVLMLIGRLLHLPYHVFNVLICMIIFTFISKWIAENSKDVGLSYLIYYSLFFFVWNLSALRQALVMSVALYYILNKNKLDLKWQILLVLGLTTIHASALILLLYMFIDKLNLNLKKHIILLVFCCIVTVIPLYRIFEMLPDGIPLVSSVAVYLENGINPFWNVQGILRLVMVLPLLIIYNQYSEIGLENKKQIDIAILGISIYFLVRFAELSSARLLAYSLILCVIIYVNGISILPKKWLRIMGKSALVVFCFMFLVKEMIALKDQTGIQSTSRFGVPVTTIFNSKAADFNDSYAFLISDKENRKSQYEEYFKNSMSSRISDYDGLNEHNKEDLIAVRFPNGLYGFIDTKGNIVKGPRFEYEPNTYRYIYEEIDEDMNLRSYWTIGGSSISYNDSIEIIEQSIVQKQAIISQSMRVEYFEDNNVPEEILGLFSYKNQVTIHDVTIVNKPFSYKIYRLTYFNEDVYVYVDENDRLLIEDYFHEKEYYNEIGILVVSNRFYTSFIDENGNVLWMQ